MSSFDQDDGSSTAAVKRTERVLSSLEARFRRKARLHVDEMQRVLSDVAFDADGRLGVENHARLARIADLALDVSAQLGFFGDVAVADLADRISRRLGRRDSWDAQALAEVSMQLDSLSSILGDAPAEAAADGGPFGEAIADVCEAS